MFPNLPMKRVNDPADTPDSPVYFCSMSDVKLIIFEISTGQAPDDILIDGFHVTSHVYIGPKFLGAKR